MITNNQTTQIRKLFRQYDVDLAYIFGSFNTKF